MTLIKNRLQKLFEDIRILFAAPVYQIVDVLQLAVLFHSVAIQNDQDGIDDAEATRYL